MSDHIVRLAALIHDYCIDGGVDGVPICGAEEGLRAALEESGLAVVPAAVVAAQGSLRVRTHGSVVEHSGDARPLTRQEMAAFRVALAIRAFFQEHDPSNAVDGEDA